MCLQMIPELYWWGMQALMPSQGSEIQADGPAHGDTSSYPTMAGRREIERGSGGVWKFREKGALESRTNRRDKTDGRYGGGGGTHVRHG